jgi:hypothetical protein
MPLASYRMFRRNGADARAFLFVVPTPSFLRATKRTFFSFRALKKERLKQLRPLIGTEPGTSFIIMLRKWGCLRIQLILAYPYLGQVGRAAYA